MDVEKIEAGGVLYYVKRSARKSICLRVREDGAAEILAPHSAPSMLLHAYAEQYASRISNIQREKAEQWQKRATFKLHYGMSLLVLGQRYFLLPMGANRDVRYDGEAYYVPPELSEEALRKAVIGVYRLHASDYIQHRVAELACQMELCPKSVKINAATSHWASCSAKHTLNFSWFCIMAKPDTVDYLVIHELCHMRYLNHSPAFWKEVEHYCPDYKMHQASLKALWRQISEEKWW